MRLCQPVYLRIMYVTVHTEKKTMDKKKGILFHSFSCCLILFLAGVFSKVSVNQWLKVKKCQREMHDVAPVSVSHLHCV